MLEPAELSTVETGAVCWTPVRRRIGSRGTLGAYNGGPRDGIKRVASVSKPTPLVNAFFDSYRAAFERSDVSAIADHFAFPLHITSDAGQVPLLTIATRQDWIARVQQLLAMRHAIGFSCARALNFVAIELSSRLIQAVVHWALLDKAGGTLYDFNAAYSLATIDGVVRITAISHNEVPRYRECLARIQSPHSVRDAGTGGSSIA